MVAKVVEKGERRARQQKVTRRTVTADGMKEVRWPGDVRKESGGLDAAGDDEEGESVLEMEGRAGA